jgi:hypothetical protein
MLMDVCSYDHYQNLAIRRSFPLRNIAWVNQIWFVMWMPEHNQPKRHSSLFFVPWKVVVDPAFLVIGH